MTKEELIKLSRENLRKSKQGSLCECYDEAFIKGYQLSEKCIAELEDKLANADYQLEGRDNEIAELEKENAELKENFRICEKNADTYFDNLTKATKIIENIIQVTWGEGWNYSLDWKVKAEQFLKDSEVEK